MEEYQYFLVIHSEDGMSITKVNDIEEFLNEAIEEKYEFDEDFPTDKWDGKKNRIDRNSPQAFLLIKGKIIVPKKIEVVTKYEI